LKAVSFATDVGGRLLIRSTKARMLPTPNPEQEFHTSTHDTPGNLVAPNLKIQNKETHAVQFTSMT